MFQANLRTSNIFVIISVMLIVKTKSAPLPSSRLTNTRFISSTDPRFTASTRPRLIPSTDSRSTDPKLTASTGPKLTASATGVGRLNLVDWSSYNHQDHRGEGTYAFGYDIEDAITRNVQFRTEEHFSNGTTSGSYGYLEPDGNIHMVHYVADDQGFRYDFFAIHFSVFYNFQAIPIPNRTTRSIQ